LAVNSVNEPRRSLAALPPGARNCRLQDSTQKIKRPFDTLINGILSRHADLSELWLDSVLPVLLTRLSTEAASWDSEAHPGEPLKSLAKKTPASSSLRTRTFQSASEARKGKAAALVAEAAARARAGPNTAAVPRYHDDDDGYNCTFSAEHLLFSLIIFL
jgi:hypothetical protein